MKKQILAFSVVLLALSLTVYGIYAQKEADTDLFLTSELERSTEVKPEFIFSSLPEITKEESEFHLDFGSRFHTTKTLKELQELRTFQSFFGEFELRDHLDNISVVLIGDNMTDLREVKGTSMDCTSEQLKFFDDLNYSDNFRVDAYFHKAGSLTKTSQWDHWTPHVTVVPELQAEYALGGEAFMDYVRTGSESFTQGLDIEKAEAGKLFFSINERGEVVNLTVKNSCGFEDIDAKMINLISRTPGIWIPAENGKGEKVVQEFVLSFGRMGC